MLNLFRSLSGKDIPKGKDVTKAVLDTLVSFLSEVRDVLALQGLESFGLMLRTPCGYCLWRRHLVLVRYRYARRTVSNDDRATIATMLYFKRQGLSSIVLTNSLCTIMSIPAVLQ